MASQVSIVQCIECGQFFPREESLAYSQWPDGFCPKCLAKTDEDYPAAGDPQTE